MRQSNFKDAINNLKLEYPNHASNGLLVLLENMNIEIQELKQQIQKK